MASTATPYGLRPVRRLDGLPYAGSTNMYLIDPAGEATNIFYGQVVYIDAGVTQLCHHAVRRHFARGMAGAGDVQFGPHDQRVVELVQRFAIRLIAHAHGRVGNRARMG